MIIWRIFPDTIQFQVENSGQFLNLTDWTDPFLNPDYAACMILWELYENGQAQADEDTILVPYSELVRLNPEEKKLLELPQLYPFDIQIDSRGIPTDPDFRLQYGFFIFAHGGKQLYFKRFGCLLINDFQSYCVSHQQWVLLENLDAFSELPEKTVFHNYQWISMIQNVAKEAGAKLDPFLSGEHIISPVQWELDLKTNTDQSISPLPVVLDPRLNNFPEKFDKFRQVKGLYSFEHKNGERTRLIVSPDLQTEAQKFKQFKNMSGEQKDLFLEHPEVFFNPDLINLENFSKRVLELGLYKPKYQSFVSPYKSEWIPGFLLEREYETLEKITVQDIAQLALLEKEIKFAIAQSKKEINWQGTIISIEVAQELYEFSSNVFKNKGLEKEFKGKKVLIIKENLDILEHQDALSDGLKSQNFADRAQITHYLSSKFELMPHQVEGLGWLQTLYQEGLSGALLADDMGLGKTLQTLAFLIWAMVKSESELSPCLIVAPVSLLENWEREYRRFFPESPFPIITAYGPKLNQLSNTALKDRLSGASQLVLTTYETLRKQQLGFCAVNWDVVILDEAQRIKTPGTLTTNSAKALKAKFKVAATGTPVENSLVDLWCILDFAAPGLLLSARDFREKYQDPLSSPETDMVQLGKNLRNEVGFYLLRRMKSEILDSLPPKHEKLYSQLMPEPQRKAYWSILNELQKYQKTEIYGIKLLEALHYLKAVSDHPYLVDRQMQKISVDRLIETSAKLQTTLQILEDVKLKNEKVILFAERRKTQHLLRRVVQEKFQINPSIINGDTPPSASKGEFSRQELIDHFQACSGFNVIIMSPLAAGVGLNVTEANHVVHYSRHWNPAKEDQATDRVYRIGQKQAVFVHLPMAVSPEFKSFDVVLAELLQRKRLLAQVSLIPQPEMEVRPDEIIHSLISAMGNVNDLYSAHELLNMVLFDSLETWAFKKACGLILKSLNFAVEKIPADSDKTITFKAKSKEKPFLVGVVQGNQRLNRAQLEDLVESSALFQENAHISQLALMTNQSLEPTAQQFAKEKQITIFDRDYLGNIFSDLAIEWIQGDLLA